MRFTQPTFVLLLTTLFGCAQTRNKNESTTQDTVAEKSAQPKLSKSGNCTEDNPQVRDALSCMIADFAKVVAGPEIFEMDIEEADAKRLDQYLLWLKNHIQEAKVPLIEELKTRKGNEFSATALLVGHVKLQEALPILKDKFLHLDRFYAWEGSFPDILHWRQYPEHFAIEVATEKISSKPLEENFNLSAQEIQKLSESKENSALYALYRLEPNEAKKLIYRKLARSQGAQEQCELRYSLIQYFSVSPTAEIKKLFGKPAKTAGRTSVYDCGPDIWPRYLQVTWNSRPAAEMLYEAQE